MSAWTWILNIGLIILYIITGYFITQSLTYLYSYTDDPNIATAYKLAAWAVAIFGLLIALTIAGIIGYFYFYTETGGELQLASKLSKSSESWWPTIFFIFMLALISLTGILSAAASHYIQISNVTNPQVKSAYYDTILSASLSLGIVILILIIIGVMTYQSYSTNTPEQINEEQIKI